MKWILAKFTKEWTQNSIEYATQKKLLKIENCVKRTTKCSHNHMAYVVFDFLLGQLTTPK